MFSFSSDGDFWRLGGALLVSACGGGKSGTEGSATVAASSAPEILGRSPTRERLLNLYIWSDYLAPNALSDFREAKPASRCTFLTSIPMKTLEDEDCSAGP